jgi:hypothetical protein
MPAYKTIVLELLRDRPMLHEQLRASGTLLPTMEQLAVAFRACHLNRIRELAEARPGSDPAQLSSEALEMALQELQESLPPESPASDETFRLDQAMAFLQRHMPAE